MKQPVSLPTYLTVRQFAAIYQLNPGTVSQLIKHGEIPAEKIGRQWRIRSDAKKMLDATNVAHAVYVLRENEVAVILERTSRQVRYLCTDGILKFKWIHGVRRFSVGDIKEYLRQYSSKRRQRKHKERGPRVSMIEWAKAQLEELDNRK